MSGVVITPETITALAGLIAAITALVSTILNRGKINATHETAKRIEQQTNGTLQSLQQKNAELAHRAGAAEAAAAKLPPSSPN